MINNFWCLGWFNCIPKSSHKTKYTKGMRLKIESSFLFWNCLQ